MLQPFAHWLLDGLAVRWWTWPGLVAAASLIAANSLVVGAIVVALGRWLRSR
ncbi:MAG: hypothetical protein R3305_06760 [Gammaproteobacteria bacterium]|nr:hypothetical protein [Gammaproteobacteria bacterium]